MFQEPVTLLTLGERAEEIHLIFPTHTPKQEIAGFTSREPTRENYSLIIRERTRPPRQVKRSILVDPILVENLFQLLRALGSNDILGRLGRNPDFSFRRIWNTRSFCKSARQLIF